MGEDAADLSLANLRMSIELVKKDVSQIDVSMERIEKLISKISDQQENVMTKASSLIDQKEKDTKAELNDLNQQIEKVECSLDVKISCVEKRIMTELKDINKTLTDHIRDEDNLIIKAKSFLYFGSLVSAVVFWFFSNPDILKIFK